MDFEEIARMQNRKVALNLSFPMSLIAVIDRYCEWKMWSVSDGITHLIREGLKREAEAQKAKGK